MITAIYLDMDGVICDFVSAALQLHKKDPSRVRETWPRGKYDALPSLCGWKSEKRFWDLIDANSVDVTYNTRSFWIDRVEAYPWADRLWDICEARAPTWILTSPSRSAWSAYGKIQWLKNWKGEKFRQYVIAPEKHHIARPHALLIDDNPRNIRAWGKRGGAAILFPRLWNERYKQHDHAFDIVVDELALCFR